VSKGKAYVSLDKERYPDFLTALHIAEILNISRRRAYEIMDYTDFPLVRIGRTKRVGREAFCVWIGNHTNDVKFQSYA
jgi:NADH:ubiquinone oxidoreductase subunit E